MSGAFGWAGNKSDDGGTRYRGKTQHYDDAVRQHKAPGVKRVNISDDPGVAGAGVTHVGDPNIGAARKLDDFALRQKLPIPDGHHALRSTAANVIIYVQDVTGSISAWLEEIFKRLPLLYLDAVKYLGTDDVEILFIAYGDVRGDRYPIQVARFGRGPELDPILASFELEGGGMGQGTESPEVVAYYILKQVDTSSAQNVFAYFTTDESGCDRIDSRATQKYLGIGVDEELEETRTVFQLLKRRMQVFCILRRTQDYRPEPIRAWWESMLGVEHVLHLDDPRRVVDILLGTLATLVGQLAQFTVDLKMRQDGTIFGKVNVATVMRTIAMVGKGTPSNPFRIAGGKARRQLPPPSKPMKSLLGND